MFSLDYSAIATNTGSGGKQDPKVLVWRPETELFNEVRVMQNLFAYGTLMCEDIMRKVSGYSLPHVPGTLRGYIRRCVRGESYPALAPHNGGRVEGVLYLNIPSFAWTRLDRFEGKMYVRQLVPVGLHDNTKLNAGTYIIRPEFRGYLEQSDWDFADFLRNGKARFEGHYQGYRLLD